MTNYDQWKTDDYSLQVDRDDADYRITEITSEIAEYEDDYGVDHKDVIMELQAEADKLKQFLGVTEF